MLVDLFGVPGWSFDTTTLDAANVLLGRYHYLGPTTRGQAYAGHLDGVLAAVQVWRAPSSRHLPSDGTWLELSRWCLTPYAGPNAGSRQHGAFVRWVRLHRPDVTTLVSYSDPSQGHTGALYKACNWQWAPTWQRLFTPPTGNGSWDGGRTMQAAKDRWVFVLRPDPRRAEVLRVKDGRYVEPSGSS